MKRSDLPAVLDWYCLLIERGRIIDSRFTDALYTRSEIAFCLNIKPGTLGNWLRYDNLITITAKETPRGASLPFIALVEALLVCELRKIGLSIKAIVAAMGEARKQLGSDMFKQDRLIEYGKGMNNDGFMSSITWDGDSLPQSVRLKAFKDVSVVADYRYAFGQPVIEGTRLRVVDITMPYLAGESIDRLSAELEVDSSVIESIIKTHIASAA